MKKLISIFIITITLSSCAHKHTESLEKSSEKTEIAFVKTDTLILHDTVYRFKADSSQIKSIVQADKTGAINMPEVVTESSRSKLSVKIVNGKLEAKALCKELEEKAKWQERRITELSAIAHDAQREKKVTETIEVRFIPKWVKILAWTGAIESLLLIIFIISKIYLKVISYGKI